MVDFFVRVFAGCLEYQLVGLRVWFGLVGLLVWLSSMLFGALVGHLVGRSLCFLAVPANVMKPFPSTSHKQQACHNTGVSFLREPHNLVVLFEFL